MKYSMMTYSVARQVPKGQQVDMKAICELTVKMGLDAMDQVTLYGYQAADLRKMADDHGIKVICYTQHASSFVNPAGPERTQALDIFKGMLDTARTLGAPRIMLPMGGREGVTRDQARAWAIETLSEALPLARQAGITTTVEHFPMRLSPFIISNDMQEALDVLPDLRITFDNGNVLSGGEDPVAAFLRHKDLTDFVHFKDWVRVPDGREMLSGERFQAALIGEGIVDYPALIKAMVQADYQGYCNLEYEGNEYPATEALPRALDYLLALEAQLEAAPTPAPGR